ncbi:hypothetical protein TPHA_0B03440 [Tetrapisispora phaffii CBS 4417]|uniref:glutathione-specific gamma-glutamylcyclotransferase n=1 Tax=Tetrapisispora phaffii (strain ATCC 24235 / CBS 4417 / NBRC 1672 / NRRL Y-8282 / UCD 70-5) TaxID=1071381 RepID=G8BPT3_TETPH|nr:hypothetical protein TPHA_0B03440 [Tetrapisispora phaffii CBS 4417]CCE62014.1 hypothetical protein TPHA_0B03440 [Tetrapisispora phaffii CBS 4417]
MTNKVDSVADKGVWILGYGSLIYKPPPYFKHRLPVTIKGFVRRFWQSSVDHRGTHEKPGRVATLINYDEIKLDKVLLDDFEKYNTHDNLDTLAVVYYIPEEHVSKVTQYLDVREQNGYQRYNLNVELEITDDYIMETYVDDEETLQSLLGLYNGLKYNEIGDKKLIETSVYIGTLDNFAFVGPEIIKDTAKIIAHSVGPSGPNYEYLKLLYESLIELQTVFKLSNAKSSSSSSASSNSNSTSDMAIAALKSKIDDSLLAEKVIEELVIEDYLHSLLEEVELLRIS